MLTAEEVEKFKNLPCKVIAITPAGIYNEFGAERITPAIPAGSIDEITSEFEVSAPAILLETALTPDNKKVIHLIHCDNSKDVTDVTIKLPFTSDSVEAFSYEEGVTAIMSAPDTVRISSFRTLCTLKFN